MGSIATMASWVSEIKSAAELAGFGDAAKNFAAYERVLFFPAQSWRERAKVLGWRPDGIDLYAPGERLFRARFEALEAVCLREMLLNSSLEIYEQRCARLSFNAASEGLVLPVVQRMRNLDPDDAADREADIADYKMAYAVAQALRGAGPLRKLIYQEPLVEKKFGLVKAVRIPAGALLLTADELIFVEENQENHLGKNVYALRLRAIYASIVELERDRAVFCLTTHSGWKFRFFFSPERADELRAWAAAF